MENEEKNGKKVTSKKELIMIGVVVALAFFITVAGIVYLVGFLMGGTSAKPAPSRSETPAAVERPVEDDILRFNIEETVEPNLAEEPEIAPPTVAAVPAPVPASAPTPVVTPPPPAPAPTPAPAPQAAPRPTPPPPPAPAQTAAPSGLPTSSPTKGAFQLQLFSSQNENKANAEAMKFLRDYPDVWIMRADLGDRGIWYRARCCSVNTREEANAIRAAIQTKYKITPDIVRGE